jgi:hypothetical protein
VVCGVVVMTGRRVGVVGGRLVVALFVVLGRLVVMPGGMFVVMRCFAMVLCCFLGHVFLLSC